MTAVMAGTVTLDHSLAHGAGQSNNNSAMPLTNAAKFTEENILVQNRGIAGRSLQPGARKPPNSKDSQTLMT